MGLANPPLMQALQTVIQILFVTGITGAFFYRLKYKIPMSLEGKTFLGLIAGGAAAHLELQAMGLIPYS
jgi:hypothetical protein